MVRASSHAARSSLNYYSRKTAESGIHVRPFKTISVNSPEDWRWIFAGFDCWNKALIAMSHYSIRPMESMQEVWENIPLSVLQRSFCSGNWDAHTRRYHTEQNRRCGRKSRCNTEYVVVYRVECNHCNKMNLSILSILTFKKFQTNFSLTFIVFEDIWLVSLNELATQRATAVEVPRAGTPGHGNRRNNFQVKFSAKLFDLQKTNQVNNNQTM